MSSYFVIGLDDYPSIAFANYDNFTVMSFATKEEAEAFIETEEFESEYGQLDRWVMEVLAPGTSGPEPEPSEPEPSGRSKFGESVESDPETD